MPKTHARRTGGPRPESEEGFSLPAWLGQEPLKLLVYVAALCAFAQAWVFTDRVACMDYYQFWAAGLAVRSGMSTDIYSQAERERIGSEMLAVASREAGDDAQARAGDKRLQVAQHRKVLETYSTPWLYTVFGLSATGNYERDESRYQHVSLICLYAAVILLALMLDYSVAAALIAAVVFTAWFAPTSSEVYVGNVNRIQLAGLALFLWLQTRADSARHAAAGAVLGSLLAFKPNLGPVAVALAAGWIAGRQYRKLAVSAAGALCGALVSVAASAWFFGSFRPWLQWAAELTSLLGEQTRGASLGDYAVNKVVSRFAGPGLALILPYILTGVMLYVIVRSGLRQRSDPDPATGLLRQRDFVLASLGGLLSLLVAQLAWLHYFMLAIPAALYALRPDADNPKRRILRAFALAALTMISLEPWRVFRSINSAEAGAVLVSCGTLLLFGLCLFELNSRSAS